MIMRDIHADDYALSRHTTEDMLKLLRRGLLDSISVLTNMTCYEECAETYLEELKDWPHQPKLSVHLNFMEGHCVAKTGEVLHLVNQNGYFTIGWKDLLIWNYNPFQYKKIKGELKAEILAQTERFREVFGEGEPLRFDGHQHTQMIPIVYRALFEVIAEQHYETEYIRVTKEPIKPFLRNFSLWKTYKPVNIVKNILLNFYAPGMERSMRKLEGIHIKPMYLWGVWMSGKMDSSRVKHLYKDMMKQASKKGRVLEILFHPGTLKKEEAGTEFSSTEALAFYTSEGRAAEYECAEMISQIKN